MTRNYVQTQNSKQVDPKLLLHSKDMTSATSIYTPKLKSLSGKLEVLWNLRGGGREEKKRERKKIKRCPSMNYPNIIEDLEVRAGV